MGKKQGDKIVANDCDDLSLRGSSLQSSCDNLTSGDSSFGILVGMGLYFSLRRRNQKTTKTKAARAIKTTKMTMMIITGTVIVAASASARIIGESRHSALKRLFATKLSMQMEEL